MVRDHNRHSLAIWFRVSAERRMLGFDIARCNLEAKEFVSRALAVEKFQKVVRSAGV